MRARQSGNAVPNDTREIDILYTRAVNMEFIFVREAGDELGHAPFGTVSFINEG